IVYLALPERSSQDLNILSQMCERLLHLQPIGRLDCRAVAGADAKPEPVGAKRGDGRCLLRQGKWMAWVGRYDWCAKADGPGTSQCSGIDDQRIKRDGILCHPELCDTGRLGLANHLNQCACIRGIDGNSNPLAPGRLSGCRCLCFVLRTMGRRWCIQWRCLS